MENVTEANIKLKPLIFSAWARILYDKGKISKQEYDKILSECKKKR